MRQPDLFSADRRHPQGLRYQPDFIAPDLERELVAQNRTLPLAPFQFGAYEGKRRVASYGWRYDYTTGGSKRRRTFRPG
ncbi:MAG: hypothetical protein ABSG83_11525 [Roseiarcus sp.]|jgi:hypothetical protein